MLAKSIMMIPIFLCCPFAEARKPLLVLQPKPSYVSLRFLFFDRCLISWEQSEKHPYGSSFRWVLHVPPWLHFRGQVRLLLSSIPFFWSALNCDNVIKIHYLRFISKTSNTSWWQCRNSLAWWYFFHFWVCKKIMRLKKLCLKQKESISELNERLARWFSEHCICQNHCRLRTHQWKRTLCP